MTNYSEMSEVERVNLGRRMGSRYFQMCAGGNRDELMQLHSELDVPGSTLLKLYPNPLDVTPAIERWSWNTPKNYCITEYPLDEIEVFLKKNLQLLDIIKKYRMKVSLSIFLGWKFIDNELHGFNASLTLIEILASAGLSLDIDVVKGD